MDRPSASGHVVSRTSRVRGSWLLFASLFLLHSWSTNAQFVNVRGERRLLFTAAGVYQALTQNVGSIVLGGDVLLNSTNWPKSVLVNGTVSVEGMNSSDPTISPKFDFGGVTNAIHLNTLGNLTVQGVTLQGATSQVNFKQPTPFLPRAQGSGLWPSLVMEVGSTVYFVNTTINYYVPQPISCQNYTAKLIFGYPGSSRPSVDADGVTLRLAGLNNFTQPVTDINNVTMGLATQVSSNTTSTCVTAVPPPPPSVVAHEHSKKLSGGGIAGVAIGAAVGLAAIIAAALAFFLLRRRRRRRDALSKAEKAPQSGSPTSATDSHLRMPSTGGSSVFRNGEYLGPSPPNGHIGTPFGGEGEIHAKGVMGSSHSVASSGGDIRSVNSFGQGPPSLTGGIRPHPTASIDPNSLPFRASDGLNGVEVGPLLGRGSYGRVYKGRWKGVPVAIKVVDHMSAAGNCVDAARESVLSKSVQHPNVVITYKICTIRLTDMASATSRGSVPPPLNYTESNENSQRLVDNVASRTVSPGLGLEKNDSALVSQGKTPGTSPTGTYDEEGAQRRPGVPGPSPFSADPPYPPTSARPQNRDQNSQLEDAPSGMSLQKSPSQEAQGVSMEALLATRPTPVGVSFNTSGPHDWDDDDDDDPEAAAERAASRPAITETWMLLEYCDRGNLDSAIRSHRFKRKADGSPDMACIYRCLIDIAAGMDYLHSVGVLHGDLKAANVLCKSTATDPRGFTCKLADFGLSRLLDPTMTHVSTKSYGTISYMPAEVLKDGRLTTAADVYSFAMMMWEVYSNQALFEGQTMAQVFYMVCYEGHRPAIPDGMPLEYRTLMEECWSPEFESRPKFSDISPRLQALYSLLRQNSRPAPDAARQPGGTGKLTTPFAAVPPSPQGSARASPPPNIPLPSPKPPPMEPDAEAQP